MDNYHSEDYFKKMGFASQRRYPNESIIRFLATHFFHLNAEQRKRVKILEVGCGSGANLWMVGKEGFSAYGIDIASTGLELCREMMKKWGVNADVRLGNMKKIDFDDNYFDLIFDIVSMQHMDLEDHLKSYVEIFRCLKKDGLFFQWHLGDRSISFVESGGNLVDKLTVDNIYNDSVPLSNNGLVCFLSPAEARNLLSIAGFSNIDVESSTRTYINMTQTIEYLEISAKKL
ncbi:MAG: class I SAM-dependent methyltransferase [Candidatus Thermoplasmatota archaeon]|nr:class I SAM-dependent methyltransferase [Candidatus Thermoplasmatota archaeon]